MRPLPEVFKALADPTRLRILRLLFDGTELHVNELVEVLELPQPTVSRHLAVLLRAGLVVRRRDGMWTFYSSSATSDAVGDQALASALRSRLRAEADGHGDRPRLEACLEARLRQSGEFYARVAPTWDRLRAGLDAEGLHAQVLGGLLPGSLDLLDAGTGTGALLPVLAPAARRLFGIDRSPEMLLEARRRAAAEGLRNVALLRADLERLPFRDESLDGACSVLALHHASRPAAAILELARVVRPGGHVVVSDLAEHGEEWMRDELAHLWLGFPPQRVAGWFEDAGLRDVRAGSIRRRRSGGGAAPDLWVVRGRRAGAVPAVRVTNVAAASAAR
jgi:ArsR family transcriptional regulator